MMQVIFKANSPIYTAVVFLYLPKKKQKVSDFPTFSGGIEREQRYEIG